MSFQYQNVHWETFTEKSRKNDQGNNTFTFDLVLENVIVLSERGSLLR